MKSKRSTPADASSKSKIKDPVKSNPSYNELQECPFMEQHVKSLFVNLELEDDPRYLGKKYYFHGAMCGVCSLDLSNKVSNEERQTKTLFSRKAQCYPCMHSRTSQDIACNFFICASCSINLNSINDGPDAKRQSSRCNN